MAVPQEKLAESLEALRKLQDRGVVAIRLSSQARLRSPAAALEISAALGGDYR